MIVAILLALAHTISVSWTPAPQAPGFTTSGYYVWRSIDGADSVRVAGPTQPSWKDTGAKSGHTYCYQVQTHGIEKMKGITTSARLLSPLSAPACVSVP